MLANLLFSINMSLPLFVLLGLGYLLRQKGMFSDDYVARSTNLVYYVMLPAKMFLETANTDLGAAFGGRYVAVGVAGAMIQFVVAWLLGNLLCRDKSKQSAFAHASFRGNFAYLGMALLQNIYNTNTVASAAVIMALIVPLYNIQGVILMSVKEGDGSFHLGKVIKSVLKNPVILSVLAALPFAFFKIELPYVASKSLGYLQTATSTMALLTVGASIKLDAIQHDLKLLLGVSGVKLIVMPILWMALAFSAGLTPEQTVSLTILGSMPAAVNVYIVTDKLGGDGQMASGAVVVTHLVSLFTMTGVVFMLRTIGMI